MTSTLEDLDSCIMETRKSYLKKVVVTLLGVELVAILWCLLAGPPGSLAPTVTWISSLVIVPVVTLVVQDYYEWHRNLERSKKIIRNSVNFLYYIEKSSTWGQTPPLVPAHILATWQILQLELDYMARRPRWNPFRYK